MALLPAEASRRPFSVLRELIKPKKNEERCELCSALLPPGHQHLLELPQHRLACCCQACALLFSGNKRARYRLVPRDILTLNNLRIEDFQWEDLHIPINLAFFFHDSTAGRIVAMYPSPAGAMESLLRLEAWADLTEQNPDLRQMEPDVQALLVNRVRLTHAYFLVPIDECYKLVGIIRTHWRGLSGGTEVWKEIESFFTDLLARAKPGSSPCPT